MPCLYGYTVLYVCMLIGVNYITHQDSLYKLESHCLIYFGYFMHFMYMLVWHFHSKQINFLHQNHLKQGYMWQRLLLYYCLDSCQVLSYSAHQDINIQDLL